MIEALRAYSKIEEDKFNLGPSFSPCSNGQIMHKRRRMPCVAMLLSKYSVESYY